MPLVPTLVESPLAPRSSLLAMALLALLPRPCAADALGELEQAWQSLFDKAAPSVVFIAAGDHFGSGFAVGKTGLILTNEHVIHGQVDVQVVLVDGKRLAGKVAEVASDDVDLALVQVPAGAVPGLDFGATSHVRIGSWAAAIGHGAGGIWTFTSGMITNIYSSGRDRTVFQTQIPINPGNSGGPILDRHGRALGVATAVLQGASNIAFGIRIERAVQTLEKMADACEECLVVKAPPGVPVLVDGQMLGKGRVAFFATAKTYDVMAVVNGQMHRKSIAFPATRRVDLTTGP